MNVSVFPTFQELFPGRTVPSLDEIINRTSSVALLYVAAFLNFKVRYTHRDISDQEKVFFEWIGVFDEPTQREIVRNYGHFKIRIEGNGFEISLFNSISLLTLMERIMWSRNELPMVLPSTLEDERTFLDAWLVSNSELATDIGGGLRPTLSNLFEQIVVNQAKQYEFLERKDVFIQILYSEALFDYFAGDVSLKKYLQEFLNRKQLKSYQQYLRALAGIIMLDGGRAFTFRLDDDNEFLRSLFDSLSLPLSVDLKNFNPGDPDFKILRTYPLAKSSEREFFILHHNFFIDKLYQGLLFDLYKASSLANEYPKFPSFRQLLGAFAEQKIFYDYVAKCFRNDLFVVKVPGNMYQDIEYSDFYVREGESIFLFEFKNVLINAQVKHSGCFATIKKEIVKKLVTNENGKPKGVSQLVNVVNRIVDGPFYFDNFVLRKIRKLRIYPILVVTDEFFNIDGVGKILNDEFQQRFQSTRSPSRKVMPITLLQIDDLVRLQLSSRSKKTQFKYLIDTYHERSKRRQEKTVRSVRDALRRYQSFKDLMVDEIGDGFDVILDRLVSVLGIEEPS